MCLNGTLQIGDFSPHGKLYGMCATNIVVSWIQKGKYPTPKEILSSLLGLKNNTYKTV